MAELTIRFNGSDGAMLTRWNSAANASAGRLPANLWPHRAMVDAQTATQHPELAQAARRAGVAVLIDPGTDLWQDQQWRGHPWLALPYARAQAMSAGEIAETARVSDALVDECLQAQLALGATALIAPYVDIDRPNGGWVSAQLSLWQSVIRWRRSSGVSLPVIPALALGWAMLARHRWPAALTSVATALERLDADEVLLAASRVDDGTSAASRLDDLLSVVEVLSRSRRVTVLRQGALGQACVIAGAAGYETGLGWGERCDLKVRRSSQRVEPTGHPAGRPKYIAALGQSLDLRTLAVARAQPRLGASLVCLDSGCCPDGRDALDRDMRTHAVRRRLTQLAELNADHPRWAWRVLADRAHVGAELAARINVCAVREGAPQTRTQALNAVAVVAGKRRLTAPLRRPAA